MTDELDEAPRLATVDAIMPAPSGRPPERPGLTGYEHPMRGSGESEDSGAGAAPSRFRVGTGTARRRCSVPRAIASVVAKHESGIADARDRLVTIAMAPPQ